MKKTGLKFEGLKVWQLAIEISVEIHRLTKSFPKDELFALTSQIKRASDSISLNIAEGAQGQSNPEMSRFLSYAIRSCSEVINCLYLAEARNLIIEEQSELITDLLVKEIKMLQNLRKTVHPTGSYVKEEEGNYERKNTMDHELWTMDEQ